MGIKPALGWLALLLFTTSAHAEGTRELTKHVSKTKAPAIAPVTPKTKAPGPVMTTGSTTSSSASLSVIESTAKPRSDYEADVYSGVPLDDALAKERGLDKGLVHLVFEHERRAAFRIGRDRIRRVVRLAGDDRVPVTVVRANAHAPSARPRDHIDVLETDEGVIVVDTMVQNAGMFTTSDVYIFVRHATLDERVGALESLTPATRKRLREALVVAEWAPSPK